MKTMDGKDVPKLDAGARVAIEDALRRHQTVQLNLDGDGRLRVMVVEKRISYRGR